MRRRIGASGARLAAGILGLLAWAAGCRELRLRPIPIPPEAREGSVSRPAAPGARPAAPGAIVPPPPSPEGRVEPAVSIEAPPPGAPERPDIGGLRLGPLRPPEAPEIPRVRPPIRAPSAPVLEEQRAEPALQYPIGSLWGPFGRLWFSFDTRPETDLRTGEFLRRLRIHVVNESGGEVNDLEATVRIGWLAFARKARHFPPGAVRFLLDRAEIRFPAIPSTPAEDPGRTAYLYLSVPEESSEVRVTFGRDAARSRTFVLPVPGAPAEGPGGGG